MKRYIAMTRKDKEALAKECHVTVRTVNNALSYVYDSDTVQHIRDVALKRGAVMMVSECNEIETIHDADGVMTQLLPNGAVIEMNKDTGDVDVYFKGNAMIHLDNIRVREISALQASAMALK